MAQTTITEALADIKTSQSRVQKKRQGLLQYVAHDSKMVDPLAKEGGSAQFIAREQQSIRDLEDKIVRIRCAIQAANLANQLTVEGETRTVASWLNWRREIAPGRETHFTELSNRITQQRMMSQRIRQQQTGALNVAVDSGSQPGDVTVNLSEKDLQGDIDRMASLLGQLDGKLSLFNATTTVDV